MATNVKHAAYTAIATILSTGLNSLTTGSSSAVSAEIDNTQTGSSGGELYADFNLTIAAQGSARSSGASISLYMQRAMDGTNYPAATNTTCDRLLYTWYLDAATTARPDLASEDVPVPGGKFKVYLVNNTGQTLAASANLVEYQLHSVTNY